MKKYKRKRKHDAVVSITPIQVQCCLTVQPVVIWSGDIPEVIWTGMRLINLRIYIEFTVPDRKPTLKYAECYHYQRHQTTALNVSIMFSRAHPAIFASSLKVYQFMILLRNQPYELLLSEYIRQLCTWIGVVDKNAL